MSKAVIASRLQHVSPSQIDQFSRCKRAWWFLKVAGLEQPKKAHFEKGEMLHSQMENWYLNGIQPENKSAQLLISNPQVPKRRDDLIIEQPRDYRLGLKLADVPVKGRIDMLDPFPVERQVDIWDWKSTSNFIYTKSPDELARNTQLLIYAKYVFSAFFAADLVRLAHGYMLTKGGSASKVSITDPLDKEHVYGLYDSIEIKVEQMKDTASFTQGLLVEGNYEACDDFGGCPYKSQCHIGGLLDAREEVSQVNVEEHKAFVEKLKAQKRTGVLPLDAGKPSKEPPAKKVVTFPLMVRVIYTKDGTETFMQLPCKTVDEAVAGAKQFAGSDISVVKVEIIKQDGE